MCVQQLLDYCFRLDGAGGVAISMQMLTSAGETCPACESCGKTFTDFKKSGLFGCADCYSQFEAHLPKLFKRVQGVVEHVFEKQAAPQDDVTTLEESLSEAVACEDFELAASIRDRLVVLKGGGATPS